MEGCRADLGIAMATIKRDGRADLMPYFRVRDRVANVNEVPMTENVT